MKKESKFNLSEFKRLIKIGMENKKLFYIVVGIGLALALLSSLRPILVGDAVDKYIKPENYELLLRLSFILVGLLIAEIILQYYFILLSNIIAQTVIEKIRVQLFDKIVHFKFRTTLAFTCSQKQIPSQ